MLAFTMGLQMLLKQAFLRTEIDVSGDVWASTSSYDGMAACV